LKLDHSDIGGDATSSNVVMGLNLSMESNLVLKRRRENINSSQVFGSKDDVGFLSRVVSLVEEDDYGVGFGVGHSLCETFYSDMCFYVQMLLC
jgi:hypothetical protein